MLIFYNGIKNLMNHFDFKFNIFAVVSLFIMILFVPWVISLMPVSFGYENGLIENIQMFILFLSCFFALKNKSKKNKKFFIFVFLILTIIMLREVNCTRTLFFQIEGQPNSFYGWKDIKYGYLAHPIYGMYMAGVGIYFIKNKLWINLINFLKNYKIPFFNLLFMLIGMFLALYAEKTMHFDIFEEIAELLFYFSLMAIIYLYSFNKVKKV